MNHGMFTSLHKLAQQRPPASQPQDFLDEHFSSSPKWKQFHKNLRSKSFVQAVKEDPRADKKLQRFSENIGRHKQSKGVPSFQVPSQAPNGKHYTVKFHPDKDRFSCNCGDWTYAKSWRDGKKTQDCKHVRMVQLELKAQGTSTLMKQAFRRLSGLLQREG